MMDMINQERTKDLEVKEDRVDALEAKIANLEMEKELLKKQLNKGVAFEKRKLLALRN